MKTIAIIPVHGRLPLLRLTIERLLDVNKIHEVICLGDTPQEHKACTEAGARFVFHKNKPVARKLNTGFQIAAEYNPDAAMYVGSADWLSENWLSEIEPFIERYDLMGKLDCNFCHVGASVRAVHWDGYPAGSSMEGQMIGIGRVLSRYALDKMCWQPFDNWLDASLDYSMIFKLMKFSHRRRRLIMNTKKTQSLSISTDLWSNIHSFHQQASGSEERSQTWLTDNFPEIYSLKSLLYGSDQTMPKMSLYNRDSMC